MAGEPDHAPPPAAEGSAPTQNGEAPLPQNNDSNDSSETDPSAGEESDREIFDFESAYDEVKHQPVRVGVILLQGFHRTKASVVAPAMLKVKQARNLDELKDALLESEQYLNELGIFAGVELTALEAPRDAPRNTCLVKLKVAERSALHANAGTYAQGTEGSVEFTVGLTNPTGHGESMQVSAEFGSQSFNEFVALLRKPHLRGSRWHGEVRLLQHSKSWEKQSSYTELLRGGSVGIVSSDGHHGLTYELDWRQVSDPGRHASRSVIAQCGHSLKSAVRYVYTTTLALGPSGSDSAVALRTSTEVAGVGPGSNLLRHVRQQLSLQGVRRLYGGSWMTWGVQAGVLLPYGASSSGGGGGGGGGPLSRSTCISDRFFLGGPGSLWGFKTRGAGPTDARRRREPAGGASSSSGGGTGGGASSSSAAAGKEDGPPRRDALGGDLYATLIAAFNFPLPSEALQRAGLHGHFFVQGGSTVLLSGIARPLAESVEHFSQSFRWTMGAGLVWPTSLGNLEVNYCQVLKSGAYDRVRNGLQVGFTPLLPL